MPPTVHRVPENRIPVGISVYDAEADEKFTRMIVVNHAEVPSGEFEIPETGKTIAEYNPEYDSDAPVVETVYREELNEDVDGWKWMPVEKLAEKAESAGIASYSYPATRLKTTSSHLPNRVGTHRELFCYQLARLAHLAATIEHPEQFQEPRLWETYNKQLDGEISSSSILKENKYQLKENQGICTYCNREAETTFDHIIPSDSGGTDGIDNLVPACQSCNSSKSNQNIIDWHQKHSIPIDRVVLGKYIKIQWNDLEREGRLDSELSQPVRERWSGLEITRRIENRVTN